MADAQFVRNKIAYSCMLCICAVGISGIALTIVAPRLLSTSSARSAEVIDDAIDIMSPAQPTEASGKKADCEMKYWLQQMKLEGYEKMVSLRHDEYHRWFTTKFGLDDTFYENKRIADVGPGPRGSLEWADMAKLRVGIDPITESYMELGIARQKMSYVAASASAIPFPDGYFDVVTSLNSLDHVSDLAGTISEIQRILKPGGLFLFVTDVNHKATPCEPQQYGWDIVDRFSQLEQVSLERYEKYAPGSQQYKKLMEEGKAPEVHNSSQPYDFSNPTRRYGTLVAKLRKREQLAGAAAALRLRGATKWWSP